MHVFQIVIHPYSVVLACHFEGEKRELKPMCLKSALYNEANSKMKLQAEAKAHFHCRIANTNQFDYLLSGHCYCHDMIFEVLNGQKKKKKFTRVQD